MDIADNQSVFARTEGDSSDWIFFMLAVPATVFFAYKIKMPSAYLFGGVLGTAILIINGFAPPHLPKSVTIFAQLCVGIGIGTRIRTVTLANWKKLLLFTLMGVVMIIGVSFILAKLLTITMPLSIVTAFLSTSPGGLTEMSITAMSLHENVAVVLAYQLFRLIFIIAVIAPILKIWLIRRNKPSS